MTKIFRTIISLWPVFALALIPTTLLLVFSFRTAKNHAQADLDDHTRAAKKRLDEIIEDANRKLNRVIVDTKLVPNEALRDQLARIVYEDLRFREAGVIDAQGNLVLTDRGFLVPPVPVKADERPNRATDKVEVLGRFRTYVMNEESLIISRLTPEFGSVNVLVQPDLLFYSTDLSELGPTGYLAFVRKEDGQFLAGIGSVPIENDIWTPELGTGRLRSETVSNDGRVLIVSEVSSSWALRFWWGELGYMVPIIATCTLGLVGFALTRSKRGGLDHDLRIGLKRNEFEIHYQPVIEIATGRWVGAEALIRWNHPKQGRIRPDLFIPIAEETGLIKELTEWLIRRAAVELESLLRQKPNFYLSINLPPRLLIGGQARKMLDASPTSTALSPDRIVFELTERDLLSGGPELIGEMQALTQLGVRFGVDDFGTGYSSLAYLHQFPFHVMKIDKSFLPNPGRSESAFVVLEALIQLGKKLNLLLIAEGIEDQTQANLLQSLDVKFGQGWLYCAAIPASQFTTRYEAQSS